MRTKFISVLSFFIFAFGLNGIKAQDNLEISLTDYESTALSTQPKMFGIPLVADIQIIGNESRNFSMESSISLPKKRFFERKFFYVRRVDRFVQDRLQEIKTEAIYKFSEETGADVIVSPLFSITTISNRGLDVKVLVKAHGFPAKYNNFRNLTDADTTLVKTSLILRSKGYVENIGKAEYEKEVIINK